MLPNVSALDVEGCLLILVDPRRTKLHTDEVGLIFFVIAIEISIQVV